MPCFHHVTFQASIDSDRGSNGYPTPKVKDDKTKLSYKCNFPTELCGRLIGKFGKNINFIKEKTFANVALSTNPFTPAFQLCSIEGKLFDFRLITVKIVIRW